MSLTVRLTVCGYIPAVSVSYTAKPTHQQLANQNIGSTKKSVLMDTYIHTEWVSCWMQYTPPFNPAHKPRILGVQKEHCHPHQKWNRQKKLSRFWPDEILKERELSKLQLVIDQCRSIIMLSKAPTVSFPFAILGKQNGNGRETVCNRLRTVSERIILGYLFYSVQRGPAVPGCFGVHREPICAVSESFDTNREGDWKFIKQDWFD
ncbi:hypothetical protein FB45DRAFT_878073 [Roridomyces roridus]|uniref:Uncharacterized protein n=1 Tax=Roridomyces roridus TaxID=1738132 RepID=A0AAD7B162_9AGAR|nr:hypothetical protein FB45DRAFT_878073 [Roridomyces roridus]